MADDDEDDCTMTAAALAQNRLTNEIRVVHDGVELLDYLHRRGKFADERSSPRPGLILLDLNMPRMNGREALTEIKGHPDLRQIPVVVLTTSKTEEDIFKTYNLGANSFISKPVTFQALVEVVRVVANYWLEIVALPPERGI
jgi:CheY-like chemotaxis protein